MPTRWLTWSGGATVPLVPRRGPMVTTGPPSASRHGEHRALQGGTRHLTESAAASKAVNRETTPQALVSDIGEPPSRTVRLVGKGEDCFSPSPLSRGGQFPLFTGVPLSGTGRPHGKYLGRGVKSAPPQD